LVVPRYAESGYRYCGTTSAFEARMPASQVEGKKNCTDMALKIKEEVQKQIDAGFLVTSEYP